MKTALITGATSGIGMEFARRYAALGYRLILVGRRTERMDAFEKETGAEVRKISKDLSSVEACKELLFEVENETIDVFINNAGFGTRDFLRRRIWQKKFV